MVIKSDFTYDSINKKSTIHATMWKPEGEIKAILQIAHGMKEHIGRYNDFAEYLAERGILVVGDDHTGHGRTGRDEGNMGYFVAAPKHTPFYTVVRDIYGLTLKMKEEYKDIPYFLMGHSLGSFFARAYCMNYGNEIDGAIIMGTGRMPAPVVAGGSIFLDYAIRFKRDDYNSELMNKLLSYYFDMNFLPVRTISDWVSATPEEVDIYNNDPYCTINFSLNGFKVLTDSLTYIQEPKNINKIPKDLPMFLVSGKCDPLGEMGKGVFAIYREYKNMGIKEIKGKLYDNCRHEILHDSQKETVYEDIEKWLYAHI